MNPLSIIGQLARINPTAEHAPVSPFSLAAQLAALTPIPPTTYQRSAEEAADRARHVFDVLKGIGNATPSRLQQDLPYSRDSLRKYLRILMSEGKIVSYRMQNQTWYSVANPAKRRDERRNHA